MRVLQPLILAVGTAILLFALSQPGVSQQSFTCGFSGRPACLDYGDTVCSSLGKCVANDAVCFEPYQCDYEGFTCRSNLTDCAQDYEDLVDEYNDLLRDARSLATDYDNLAADYERLRSDYSEAQQLGEELADDVRDLRRSQDDAIYCIENAGTLSEAQDCAYGY